MNLVIGATGMLGSAICRRLRNENQPVRAMVRPTSSPEKVAYLHSLGVETVEGDLRRPDTFSSTLKGIDTVISTVSCIPFSYVPEENDIQSVDLKGMQHFIDAAQTAGVEHFIYTSFSKQIDQDFPLCDAKREVEQHLIKSGIPYTILRPSYYMEIWLSPALGFDPEHNKAVVYGEGTQKISYISYQDVAKFAVSCLNRESAKNQAFELGGPEGISQLEAVHLFENFKGTSFELQQIPLEVLTTQQQEAEDPMQQSFSGLQISLAKGNLIDMHDTLAKIPIELTSVRDYAKTSLGVLAG